jgi:hypothetical protein
MDNIGRVILIVVAGIAIVFLLLVCAAISVIVILALLGPAIGNVFSNITENIATMPPP